MLSKAQFDVKQMKSFLFKLNLGAVTAIVVSGILMSIDQTNILTLWQNIQTWSVLLIVKVVLTVVMMLLGFYQTTKALGKYQHTNKFILFGELSIGIILILVGVIMSQLNIPG